MNRNPVEKSRGERGNAMVEFAIATTLLVPMLFGVFQFGYSFYIYNRLIAAVRDGARYASLRTYDSTTSTPSSGYLTAVKNSVVYGQPTTGTSAVVPGLTTSNVGVSVTMNNNVPNYVTVSISNYSVDAVFTTFNWTNKPAVTFRYEGRYAP
jgi:Flp pilus assembly protein TadG